MTTTPAVAPLSAEMDSILDKMEMIAQVVKGDRLPNTAKALSGLIAQARAATVASVEDARDAARYRVLRLNVWPGQVNIAMTKMPPPGQKPEQRIDMLCDLVIERATQEGK